MKLETPRTTRSPSASASSSGLRRMRLSLVLCSFACLSLSRAQAPPEGPVLDWSLLGYLADHHVGSSNYGHFGIRCVSPPPGFSPPRADPPTGYAMEARETCKCRYSSPPHSPGSG